MTPEQRVLSGIDGGIEPCACLDEATLNLVELGAQANGMSKGRWVAEILRKNAVHEWPRNCLD
jgi:hypothetical protein